MILKGASQEAVSYLFQKEKQLKGSHHHSRAPHYLWPVMWTLCCSFLNSFCFSDVWFPTRKTEKTDITKDHYHMTNILPTRSFQHSIFGEQYKMWDKKHYYTDVSAQRFNNLLNVTSYGLKASRSIEDFINFMVRFLDGSQRLLTFRYYTVFYHVLPRLVCVWWMQ